MSLDALETPDLLEVISDLMEIREMKAALNVSSQCGLITSIFTIAGALAGGPAGLIYGGLLGTSLATYHAIGKFKSVPEILKNDASPEQKEKLADAVRNILTAQNIFTLVEFTIAIDGNLILVHTIYKIVREFMITDMGYQVA